MYGTVHKIKKKPGRRADLLYPKKSFKKVFVQKFPGRVTDILNYNSFTIFFLLGQGRKAWERISDLKKIALLVF